MRFFKPGVFGVLILSVASAQASSIATSSVPATKIGKQVLEQGGNAVDAACAAVFALGVAQPYFTGIGSGGLAVLNINGENHFLDFREAAPEGVNEHLYQSGKGNHTGAQHIGIPGVVDGCGNLIQHFGKHSFRDDVMPAADLAQAGIEITQLWSEELEEQWSRLQKFPLSIQALTSRLASGASFKAKEIWKQPRLAQTLQALAEQGPRSFYEGPLASQWLEEAQKIDPEFSIQPSALKNYSATEYRPIVVSFGGQELITANSPSSSMVMVGEVLRFIHWYHGHHEVPAIRSLERYVVELEAENYFAKIRKEQLSDASHTTFQLSSFQRTEEASAFAEIDRRIQDRLQKNHLNTDEPQPEAIRHTAHVSVSDDAGNVVSITTSLGDIFGSGMYLPENGFFLNSQLTDFDTSGVSQNLPEAGKRPRSDMSPSLIRDSRTHEIIAAVGAAGGSYIPTVVVQFIVNTLVYRMNPQDAVAFPRAHRSSMDNQTVEIEESAGKDLIAQFKKAGYAVEPTDTIWAVLEATLKNDHGWNAVSDPRYDGLSWSSQP